MKKFTLLTLLYCLVSNVYANNISELNFDDALLTLQQQWVEANYVKTQKAQKNDFTELQQASKKLTVEFPNHAEAWIWHGIVQSSFAGAKGGLGALSLADDAKSAFEKALSLDETALQGSAHTSLGILYLKVPGWPLSFGDNDKSEQHLKAAVKMNPTGIDINYFLAEFYLEQDQYEKAKEHLLLAQAAPQRVNRASADKFRQQEVLVLLAKVNESIAKH
ncbi:tetratricopeptide repeat protein [Colwellia sp. MB02u-6]|uniref:tetratricopeptide repeat protein n=1 Tax=Colwellia sp. MB02u-6 TaxID=2759824 RepID=UPI0015F68C36|nr:tetratricopeptide repeat protein [Colwellia sp. MB02u-6]MBA6328521.1 tetratricopeptide repeat protein [Colwellia sp. MB02u-6]